MKKIYLFALLIALALGFLYFFDSNSKNTYQDLEKAVVEEKIVENKVIEPKTPEVPSIYKDLIKLTNLKAGDKLESPVLVTGEARGAWYFEGSFPVVLVGQDGLVIAEGLAETRDDWMTEEYVPFSAQLIFDQPVSNAEGTLILRKSNPSALPENDDAYGLPVSFK